MSAFESIIAMIQKNDLDQLKTIIETTPDWIKISLNEQVSILMFSVYYGRADATHWLLDMGHPINLFEASALGDVERLKHLLTQEPEKLNAFSGDGFQPLGLACFFGHTEIAKLLIDQGAEVNTPSRNTQIVTPLHSAAAADNFEIVNLLVDHGADVNACQQGDFTPLHAAAQNGNLAMARFLVERGARVDARNSEGLTSLDFAAKSDNPVLVDYLSKQQ